MIGLLQAHDMFLLALACSPYPTVNEEPLMLLGLDARYVRDWLTVKGPGSISFFRLVDDEPMDTIIVLRATADQLPMYDQEIRKFPFHATVLSVEDVFLPPEEAP